MRGGRTALLGLAALILLALSGVFIGLLPRPRFIQVTNHSPRCLDAIPKFMERSTVLRLCGGESKRWTFFSRGSDYLHLGLISEEQESEWSCDYLDGPFKFYNRIDLVISTAGEASGTNRFGVFEVCSRLPERVLAP